MPTPTLEDEEARARAVRWVQFYEDLAKSLFGFKHRYEFAESMDVSRAHLSEIMGAKKSSPGFRFLRKLRRGYLADLNDLVDREPPTDEAEIKRIRAAVSGHRAHKRAAG